MLRKGAICLLLSLAIVSSFVIVYASETDLPIIMPRYDNASSVTARITVDSGVATIRASAEGKTGVTKIKCTMTLQKKSGGVWNNVQSWSKEVNARTITFKKTQSVNHGTYRTKAYFKVYKGTSYEAITKYSSQTTY